MRAGLWDDAHECRQKDHQSCIRACPVLDIYVLQSYAEHEKHSECPCEDGREMFSNYVLPEVLIYEMIRGEDQYEEDDDAKACKEDVHPVFAQKVEAVVRVAVTVVAAVSSMLVAACFALCAYSLNCLLGMVMSGVSGVVVTETAGSQGSDEDCKTDEHAYASPTEMAGFLYSAFGLTRNRRSIVSVLMLMFARMVMQLESFAVSLYTALFVIVLMAVLRMFPVIHLVYNYTDNDRQNKQHSK